MTAQRSLAAAREAEAACAWLIEHGETDAAESLRIEIERTMLCALSRSSALVDIASFMPRAALALVAVWAC